MSETLPFDAIVIGAGQAGPGIARHLAAAGQRVALIEADKVGGTCLNRGCRPTKALRASARVAHLARTAGRHGVCTGQVSVDFAAVMARKDALVDQWVDGYADSLAHTDGLTLLYGEARFTGRSGSQFAVAVGDRSLTAAQVFLNVGTRATKPPIPGLDDVAWLDNDRVLHLDELPTHLVILGGSYIGLELGQLFARFGSAVTIVERGERIAAREDADISAEIARFLTAEGVGLRMSATVERIEPMGDGVRVHVAGDDPIDGSHLLVAIGRTPNTDRLDLDRVGLETDDRGFVPTDGVFRTAVDGIWALGDINSRGAFTHTSYQDSEILVDHLSGGRRTADGRIPTYAMFTDPPLGRVGMTEREAKASGRSVSKATIPASHVTRAVLDGETDGLISILVDAESERILGASVLCIAGDEIVQIISALMHADASCRVLAEMLPIHPTVAEFYPTILGRLAPLEAEVLRSMPYGG
ncbi:MAG TPA: mercuric reductase [Ilumatobacteraceae bacterium]|nr:mercuric reductase [Ilumatobacteraceae bacterium]